MNAPAPLAIETYVGGSQAVHPDVVYVPSGFAGYTYWMGFTPYPYCQDRLENPSVRASHDGLRWELPQGIPDPVIKAPARAEEHHADPDLVFAHGRLFMFYMTTNEHHRRTTFSVVSTDDGISWSRSQIVHDDRFGVSPAVVHHEHTWRMWYVDYDSDSRAADSTLLLREGASATELGPPRACQVKIEGHVLWHLDVIATAHGFEALFAAFPRGSTSSRCRLFHATSEDGLVWTCTSRRPILGPSRFGWDDRVVYRSSFIKDGPDAYRIWYTGGSWSRSWGIGFVRGSLRGLSPDSRAQTTARSGSWRTDLVGITRYAVGRMLPHAAVTRLRRLIP